ncbi:hypothetical protein OSB04_001547 [Centaurea solstitialis]|uniref:Jacalin-type lectin domain-containing protein n=1 Tax=Centaurea solstitialis TaxID=347529 RepID=A0AA38WUZ3_9ASTR|nr:hypothetical protein OSB04_001547 [Centaurea solstitialis]
MATIEANTAEAATVEVGPLGCEDEGATLWKFQPEYLSKFTKIRIAAADSIDSITFTYEDVYGREQNSQTYGGNGGKNHTFELKEHDEVITKLTGTYDDTTQIRSLAFYTSKGRKHGEYGANGSTYMSLPVAKGKIIGFFGSNGDHLNTIGVIIEASPYDN